MVKTAHELTDPLLQAYLAITGNVPPPKGFLLVVGQGEIIFLFYENEDWRIADRPKMTLDGKGEYRCLGTMEIEGQWDDLAQWCKDKIQWYCGILGISQEACLAAT